MTPDIIMDITQRTLFVIALLTAPRLLSALAVGLLVGMFQAATSISEQTLAFIPKLMILLVSLLVAGDWMLNVLLNFTRRLYHDIPFLIG